MNDKFPQNFSFTLDLATEDAVIRTFKAGFECSINGSPCNILFSDDNKLVCTSRCESLYPSSCDNIAISLEDKVFNLPKHLEHLNVRIKKSLLLNRSFSTGETETIFPLIENASDSVNSKRRILILIPQNSEWNPPDFTNCFYGSLNSPPPVGGWDASKRLSATINGKIDSGIAFEYLGIRYITYTAPKDSRIPNSYMAIETLDAIDPDIAQRMTLKIISAIGFFTGDYPFGSLWLFDADTHRFVLYNGCVISAARGKFRMISLNPYAYFTESDIRSIRDDHLKKASLDRNVQVEAEPYTLSQMRGRLKPVEAKHLNRLLSLMESDLFLRPFHLLQTLSTTLSTTVVFVRLSVYMTCLEMCKKWVKCDIAGEAMIPRKGSFAERECKIPDKYREEFVHDIHNALSKISGAVSAEDIRKIKDRLAKIFTKRLPNEETLKRPFEYFDIDISSKRDQMAFSLRNSIAHGEKTITSVFNTKDVRSFFDESEEKCFAFHSLIWRLIMVAIGYHGIYRDLPTLNKLNREGLNNNLKPVSLDF